MRRVAACLPLTVGATLVVAACPPRELTIDITEQGVGYLVDQCTEPTCDEIGTDPANCCVAAIPRPAFGMADTRLAVQLALVEQTEDGPRVMRARSSCMRVGLDCLLVADKNEARRCLTLELRALVEEHLGDGLAYDGIDPDRTNLILTVHASPTPGEEAACVPDHLFACAGFDAGADDPDVYQIRCATCAERPALGANVIDVEAIPCFGRCFLSECSSLLRQGINDGL